MTQHTTDLQEVKAQLKQLLEQHTLLHIAGYGRPRGGLSEKIEAYRAEMFTDHTIETVSQLCEWLRCNIEATKGINTRRSSYGLKHIAEREIGYVTNGAFIAAALLCGYRMGPLAYNPSFGMDEGSIKRTAKRLTRR